MAALLLADAKRKAAREPGLRSVADDAEARIEDTLLLALEAEPQPLRQGWILAEHAGVVVGVGHSVLVPVPPIYAGRWGEPGLLMPDCTVSDDAPEETLDFLLDAAEADMQAAGATVLLASSVEGERWGPRLQARGYRDLTLYLAKVGFKPAKPHSPVRGAVEQDVPGIVSRSAENRALLEALHSFWTRHPDADHRFSEWMSHSLTLADRDMLVLGRGEDLVGYIIAQPASRLHFPAAHEISRTGIIDDFYSRDLADALRLGDTGEAFSLLSAAEQAFATRGMVSALVVCPAAWTSKRSVLEDAGYGVSMTWMIK